MGGGKQDTYCKFYYAMMYFNMCCYIFTGVLFYLTVFQSCVVFCANHHLSGVTLFSRYLSAFGVALYMELYFDAAIVTCGFEFSRHCDVFFFMVACPSW